MTCLDLIGEDRRALHADWHSVTVNHLEACRHCVVRERIVRTVHALVFTGPGPFRYINCLKIIQVVGRRPAAGEMDEPSEQMRPLLRTVSARPTQLTVGPPLHLCGSLSVFAPCLPKQPQKSRFPVMLGNQIQRGTTRRMATIVSRLSASDTWHGYKLCSGLPFNSTRVVHSNTLFI